MKKEEFKKVEEKLITLIDEHSKSEHNSSSCLQPVMSLDSVMTLVRFLDIHVGMFWDSYSYTVPTDESLTLINDMEDIVKEIKNIDSNTHKITMKRINKICLKEIITHSYKVNLIMDYIKIMQDNKNSSSDILDSLIHELTILQRDMNESKKSILKNYK